MDLRQLRTHDLRAVARAELLTDRRTRRRQVTGVPAIPGVVISSWIISGVECTTHNDMDRV